MVLGYQRKPENSGKHLVKPTKLQSFYKLSFFLFLMYRNISLNSLRISDNSFGSYSPQLLPFPFFLFLQIHSLCCSYTLEYVGTGTWLTYQSHALKENWLSFSQNLSIAKKSLTGSGTLYPPTPSMLGFCLTWVCPALVHSVSTAVNSSV